ncbi:YAP-binding/Alf4/Glomulin [Penicillium maclennaniae]|uniref:YAP-binding/Alf4/Glomulin n=1 Tax=Penicillium maclennaniae TaxID=1343394 RepID=UPI00253FD338|nr:YAP-binding/Alf4/Glomulin [Penicillium maclennaniae]KAJ5677912.1 YAP-binding/Alf4/Glomulin [Penicillium maclennaniae]
MDPEDPLVQALPPATDYLTYLTLLEYQLTPKRLPLLHQLLQDERLTTNIGWDLVKLLLPMLPASTECLQDVARLGNPREVILRVSEALMQLQPEEDEEDEEAADDALAKHILQFNCLLSMLSVLHGRIQTKSPSRFIATSLQAALEAYTAMPCDETTLALLEFLRDLSPSKRPAPPPRAPSESSVLRTAKASAPDPEPEVAVPSPSATNETLLVRKFIQFGLIELFKSYLLSFSGPMDPGMSWTVRMQEHLHPSLQLPEQSQTQAYSTTKELKERDMLMGKIVALSRDIGIDSTELLSIVSRSSDEHRPPLDFEEPPASPDEIPLERHGSLLLLAARAAGSTLFISGNMMPPLSVFPDIAVIFTNFLGAPENVHEVTYGEPQALLDSLLALTVHAMQNPIVTPSSETEFKNFVIALTACTARQTHGIVRQIPTTIVHSHPSSSTRFKLIRSILEASNLTTIRDSAVTWLREEIIGHVHESAETVFHDPLHFWILFQSLFTSVNAASSASILDSWTCLTQTQGPALHSALNLYYLLLSSPSLRDTLQLEKTVVFFRSQVLEPLYKLFRAFESDLTAKGGDGIIESAVGEEMCQVGNARSVGLIGLTLDQIEEAIHDAYGTDDSDLKTFTQEEETRASEIRKETEGWQ